MKLIDVYASQRFCIDAETLLALVDGDNINQSFAPSTMTPLKLMIKIGTPAQLQRLLEMGADPCQNDQSGWQSGWWDVIDWAIMSVARYKSDVVRVLLDRCTLPAKRPLLLLVRTAMHSCWENVWLLLDHGVSHDNNDNNFNRFYAYESGKLDVLRVMIKYRDKCRESVRTVLCIGRLTGTKDVWGLIARHA